MVVIMTQKNMVESFALDALMDLSTIVALLDLSTIVDNNKRRRIRKNYLEKNNDIPKIFATYLKLCTIPTKVLYDKCTRAEIHLHFNDLDNILIKSFRDMIFIQFSLTGRKPTIKNDCSTFCVIRINT